MKNWSILILILGIQINLFSKDKWDITKPDSLSKNVEFNLNEGTWMNLDVSPDGKKIVFDLLGDIYIMPISGGKATPLRTGRAFEIQPRFSPDGKQILFTSDAGGGDNIWKMNIDGTNAQAITKENFRLLNNAVWTPDGNYIIAKKHFTSRRSLGAGEMWIYHTSGGEGIQLTKRKNDQQDVNEPSISPDGKILYFSEDMYPGGHFQYNKDPNKQIFIIRKYDFETGEVSNIITGNGSASRPQISRDGKKLAYIKRIRTKTVLLIHNLATGEETIIYKNLTKDQMEAWTLFGTYPGFSWTPDNQNIIIWSEGKIKKINTETQQVKEIPFELTSKHNITDALHFEQKPFTESFTSKVIRASKVSPDEKTVVFCALGNLWKKTLPKGKPTRLTSSTDFEFEPNFSPDGNEIVFTTWNDETKGSIKKINLKSGNIQTLTKEKGIYRNPSYSNDGTKIVYQKSRGNSALGFTYTKKSGLYWTDKQGNKHHFITKYGRNPYFNVTNTRIFFQSGGEIFADLDKSLKSVNLDGKDQKTHFHAKYATQFLISPDNKWVAFTELFNVYITPFTNHGKTFELNRKEKNIPIVKVSEQAGTYIQWASNSKKLYWTMGENQYSVELKKAFQFLNTSKDTIKEIKTDITPYNLKIKSDKPEGIIAFTNAKIITMNGKEIIENGTIIIEDNRIKTIGKTNEISIPKNAKIIDCNKKTIIPGFIDTHAHMKAFRGGLTPQKEWPYYAQLAFGITTTHDPSANTETVMSQSEMVKAGKMVGPRIFSTGTILYGADGDFKAEINSIDDARFAIKRTKAMGTFSVKSYNQPRREQRQQVIQAAREEKIMVYPEGGSTFFHNLTMILDGHTSIEHNMPVAPLYKDVISLWENSNTSNTPTLIVNYGSISGENYWYQTNNVWENKKLLQYTPQNIIDSRSRHRTMIPMEEYENGHILTSKSLKKLVDHGVHICVGSHGQLQGLGYHWEMWMLQQGGMTEWEVLRSATLYGAQYIGMEKDLGSIEVGKLADLVILEKDPLKNIKNTESVVYSVINGRIYDSKTMNEIGNYNKKRTPFYWEQEGCIDNSGYDETIENSHFSNCVCGH